MYSQSPNYVVCSNNPMYPSDRSSPPPAPPITPHTPRSASFLPQLGQVYTDNPFVPNPPPSSSPSSSSGTVSSRDSSPYPSPVEQFPGDDYSYPYVPFVEPQQYVFHPLNPISIGLPANLVYTRFKPLFTPSGIETSTPPNEGSHYVFQHVQQHFYELYRPHKTEPSEAPLSQILPHPYPSTFASDYANPSQRTDYNYQTPCEQYPQYPSARSSVDYNMFAEQNPDYIIGTSSMRYTASSPPDQGCVSPAMVSDASSRGYVEVAELPPSPPVYDVTQSSVCDPRAVSGFEEPAPRLPPNLPMKRSPSATPPPMIAFADQQPLEADSTTPHEQQEAEVDSSGESELDQEEYEYERNIKTAVPSEESVPTVPETTEHTAPSPASDSTSMLTPAPANAPPEPAHETGASLTITVPSLPTTRRRGQTGPIPVPNLTKKSRGRSVPTVPSPVVPYQAYKTRRSFVCVVTDCRKCFARGEHLKRHIRSIHTNEKREFGLPFMTPQRGRTTDTNFVPVTSVFVYLPRLR